MRRPGQKKLEEGDFNIPPPFSLSSHAHNIFIHHSIATGQRSIQNLLSLHYDRS